MSNYYALVETIISQLMPSCLKNPKTYNHFNKSFDNVLSLALKEMCDDFLCIPQISSDTGLSNF